MLQFNLFQSVCDLTCYQLCACPLSLSFFLLTLLFSMENCFDSNEPVTMTEDWWISIFCDEYYMHNDTYLTLYKPNRLQSYISVNTKNTCVDWLSMSLILFWFIGLMFVCCFWSTVEFVLRFEFDIYFVSNCTHTWTSELFIWMNHIDAAYYFAYAIRTQ